MHLSVAKEVVAMTLRGLVLITVCLANVLAAQADCCRCDCQSGGLHSPLYYLPVVPSHPPAASHGIYQSLGQVPVPDVSRYAQGLYSSGYQTTGNVAQFSIGAGQAIENSLDAGSKGAEGAFALGIQKQLQLQQQQPSFDYKSQGPLDSTSISSFKLSSGDLGQVSKVSTHQGNQYINIEQQHTPHESSSGEEINDLEHGKDHHHGKNDHYKFEYGVNDQHTHDIKTHKEEKKGDVVRGEYSLVEDDGNVRTVKYYADWKTGFHAQVHNSKSTSLG